MTKSKIQMTKELSNDQNTNQNKKYDLEDRTLKFAKDCLDLCKMFKKDTVNIELIRQLIRAAGSVGANYREANDTITKKDFIHRVGICRREAKESKYWLDLLLYNNEGFSDNIKPLNCEALQLTRIFSSIVQKSN